MRLRQNIGRVSRHASGAALCAALFYAPWDYGATGGDAIRNLNWILGAMFFFWVLGRFASAEGGRRKAEDGGRRTEGGHERTGDSVPGYKEKRQAGDGVPGCKGYGRGTGDGVPGYSGRWWFAGLAVGLLILGWGMALNAHLIFDADYEISLPLTSPLPNAPGSADFALSVAFMWRVTALLGAIWVVADLVQDRRWLLRIWWAIGLAGSSIALLGLVQKATGAPMVFWQPLETNEPAVSTFFATFYYHGNAGAFLNLALPAVLGLAFRYVTRQSNPAARALWIALSAIMVVAVISDTSRMGQSIAAFIVLAVLLSFSRRIWQSLHILEWKTALIALLVGAFALWAIIQTSHLDVSLQRWDQFQSKWSHDARWLVDRVAIGALPRAGLLGFGPGTFSVAFPFLATAAAEEVEGSWLFLHNDYLQTLLEWGWLGGALWAAVFFGGMTVGIVDLTRRAHKAPWSPRQKMILPVSLIALTGVALHAMVDFPLQIASIQLYAAVYLGICWGSGSFAAAVKG